ncbi:MAG TPA: stage II sporulation protein M [Desulfobacteria bacterium]|nr:stage II sporulation protein M [Desulfobacteria bacterium]
MEQVEKRSTIKFNLRFFIWCIGLPVLFFLLTFLLAALFSTHRSDNGSNGQALAEFLRYYRENSFREFFKIFLNNSFVAFVMIYFTPFALFIRKVWENRKDYDFTLSTREIILLYSFPAVFLTRDAIRIALIVSDLSGKIHKDMIFTFLSIIFPHGFPELVALGMAGAVGMEVTRRHVTKQGEKTPELKVLLFLLFCFGAAAYLEVRFTPLVFALLMR